MIKAFLINLKRTWFFFLSRKKSGDEAEVAEEGGDGGGEGGKEAVLPQKVGAEETHAGGKIQRAETKRKTGKIHGEKTETERGQTEESAAVGLKNPIAKPPRLTRTYHPSARNPLPRNLHPSAHNPSRCFHSRFVLALNLQL